MATVLFYAYSLLNGVTFALIFAAYTPVSIFKTFLITAGVFGAMSVYGYFTNRDLTKIGSFFLEFSKRPLSFSECKVMHNF